MIDFTKVYNDMRPYCDTEVEAARDRILQQPEFMAVLKYIFPTRSLEASIAELRKVKTKNDFQEIFSSPAVASIIQQTSSRFSYSGIENLDPQKSYLFISNHRDIVMDSAILQYVLLKNGHRSTQITFGSNLMSSQFIIDLGKINKMFTFYRGGSRVDIYKNALIHSAYIKQVITQEKESIWIAQRDGRTKDGNDQTQLSLLKMLTIKEKDHIEALKQFNIVPVSISYEIEPCDHMKVRESLISKKQKYIKAEGEDFKSVVNGIVGFKGKVHLAFGKPINEFISDKASVLTNDNIHQQVCEQMDYQIIADYQLTAFNYVCYDILNMSQNYLGSHYTEAEQDAVMEHIEKAAKGITDVDAEELKDGLLRLYAMPVVNAVKDFEV